MKNSNHLDLNSEEHSREFLPRKQVSEPARDRTEDPKIKSLLLYQLSYGLLLIIQSISALMAAVSLPSLRFTHWRNINQFVAAKELRALSIGYG